MSEHNVPASCDTGRGVSRGIVVDGLRKRFCNGFTALDGLSFSLDEGECLGILGPNGAGKSTLIKVLAAVLAPSAGSVSVFGRDIAKEAGQIRRMLGYVPQETTVDSMLNCRDNLYFHCCLHGMPKGVARARTNAIVALLRLESFAMKPAGVLSGGMKRILDIGCALVHEPAFLVLDEPTIGLDASARARVWEFVQALREKNSMTVVLSTHYASDMTAVCERFITLEDGRIVG